MYYEDAKRYIKLQVPDSWLVLDKNTIDDMYSEFYTSFEFFEFTEDELAAISCVREGVDVYFYNFYDEEIDNYTSWLRLTYEYEPGLTQHDLKSKIPEFQQAFDDANPGCYYMQKMKSERLSANMFLTDITLIEGYVCYRAITVKNGRIYYFFYITDPQLFDENIIAVVRQILSSVELV